MTSMAASAAQAMSEGFHAVGEAVSRVWQGVKAVASSAYEAGQSVLTTVARGAASVITAPYKIAKKAFRFLGRLLPFSDAEEGPLSNLSASGRAILETLASGMQQVAGLPAKVFSRVWGFLTTGGPLARNVQAQPLGWLGSLSSALAGLVATVGSLLPLCPAVAAAGERPVPAVVREREVEQRRILAERVTTVAPAPGGAAAERQALPLRGLLAKLDELADRPIDVNITVVSKLDGRAVAQAVYRSIRQEKVRNYETL